MRRTKKVDDFISEVAEGCFGWYGTTHEELQSMTNFIELIVLPKNIQDYTMEEMEGYIWEYAEKNNLDIDSIVDLREEDD